MRRTEPTKRVRAEESEEEREWWAEGREHGGGADPLDHRALRRWVPAGPHGVGLMDGPSEAGGSAASEKLCEPPDKESNTLQKVSRRPWA